MYRARNARIASTITTIAVYLIAAYPTSPAFPGSRTTGLVSWVWMSSVIDFLLPSRSWVPQARRTQTAVSSASASGYPLREASGAHTETVISRRGRDGDGEPGGGRTPRHRG